MSSNIPELSFEAIEQGDSISISILKAALEEHGFFSITNHGVSEELLTKCYSLAKDFFNLPRDVKDKYHEKSLKGARGYTPLGIETAVGETIPDQKEFWHHGPNVNDSFDSRIPKNISVSQIADFNNQFDLLFHQLNLLGLKVLSSIALILGKDPLFLIAGHAKETLF